MHLQLKIGLSITSAEKYGTEPSVNNCKGTRKWVLTVVCKKIAAVYQKAHFWLFLVEIPLRFGKALNCR